MNSLHSGEYCIAVALFSVSALCFENGYRLFYICCMYEYDLGSSINIVTRLWAG
jgi:hypothetical protein